MDCRARYVATCLPLLLLAGCGRSSGEAVPSPSSSVERTPGIADASRGPVPSSGGPVPSWTAVRPTESSAAKPRASAGRSITASRSPQPSAMVLDAKLSTTCVTPGGSMTVTLQARPSMTVIFNTRYPDGKDGQVHGGFEQNGRTDSVGEYSKSWQVDPLTPTGDADTTIAAVDQQGSGTRRLPFRVASKC